MPTSFVSIQEKQTKEVLTRKQQKGRKKGQEEESQEAQELLKRPREYTVKFTFPNPPPLSPPILGLHSKKLQASGPQMHVQTSPKPSIELYFTCCHGSKGLWLFSSSA